MSVKSAVWRQLLGLVVSNICIFSPNCATAQITPDRTLPNNSNVTLNGSVFNITGGTQAGRNLFHSFQQFSVPTGGTASFNNGLDIQNIFSRVTGGSASNIDGIIKASGTANLFFLNPNGIVFGKNASLNVGGSFVATTANAIQFGNLGSFSASEPNNPALLTVNPTALFYNQIAAASIQNSSIASAGKDPAGFDAVGLRVPDGKSLLLVGGNISIDGGQLNAYGGRVELGGLALAGNVGLNVDGDKLSLDFPASSQRADISLTNGAAAYVEAGNGGSIAINARNLDISGNSYIASGIGTGEPRNSQTGDITLNATDTIQIRAGSGVANDVFENQLGNSSDIRITAGSLFLNDKAQISARVDGKGNVGSIIINTRDRVVLDNGATISGNIGVNGLGDRGNIRISTGTLSVTNGATITANIFGQGNTGDIIINARDRVFLSNDARILNGIQQEGVGIGGTISINTGSLSIADRSAIRTTSGQQKAGDIIINARDQVSLDNDSDLISAAQRGNGGNIRINTGLLSVAGGARLSTYTFGSGKAGDIFINARDRVSFEGGSSRASGAVSQVRIGATGQGGNIEIATGSLFLDNSAQLGAVTFGQGNAGDIIINSRDQVVLANNANIVNNVQDGSGKGGDIRVTTGTLKVTNLGRLQAATSGQGNAGNVIVNARDRVEFAGSFINEQQGIFVTSTAASFVAPGAVGNAGNVEITTGSLSVTDGAELSARTQGKGNAGNVIINARDHITFDRGNVFSRVDDRSAVGKSGNVLITTGSLELLNSSQIDASTFGNGDAGNVAIVATQPIIVAGTGDDGRSSAIFSTNGDNPAIPGTGRTIVGTGKGGNITITAPALSVTDGAVIDARTFNDQLGGNINLTLGTLQLLNGGQIFTTSESSGSAGTIAINANQGVTIAGKDVTYSSRLSQFPNRIVQISPYSSLSVRSTGTGTAGNIILNTPRLTLDNQGIINAESNAVNGGNITLNTDLLLLRRNSIISATAGLASKAGNGGNITINARNGFIVALPGENSDITANAFTGSGGRVQINTQGLFGIQSRFQLTPFSDITASSESGVAGTVQIKTPDIDPSRGLISLPTVNENPPKLVSSNCRAFNEYAGGNNFTITGRGGLPPSPYEPLTSDAIWSDTRLPLTTAHQNQPKNHAAKIKPKPIEIVPATGWVFNGKGEVTLISSVSNAPSTPTSCAAR